MDNEKKRVLNLEPNVLDGDDLQTLIHTVFGQMSKYVARTYGPFGANTAYQEGGKILTTKDGWSVEQSIIYSENILASLVRKMIIDVSTAINTRSGDGTSTGLIAANEINNLLMEYKEKNRVHSKFLSSAIQYCVDKICEKLMANATPITDENLEDMIYRIAEVSLDWDKEFAGYIRDIYKTTKNPVIRLQYSGTDNSYVEYREGYDMSAKLISEFKVNNQGEKKYTVKNPILLIFSYTMNASMFEPLLTAATLYGQQLGRELVVLAPDFEKNFRDSYNALCIQMAKQRQKMPNMVLARYNADYNIEREMLIDFSFLTGAVINAKDSTEAETIIREYTEATKQPMPNEFDYKKEERQKYENDLKTYKKTLVENMQTFLTKMEDFIGECESISITDKELVASGFGDIEHADVLQDRINTIQGEINKISKDANAKSMFTEEIRLKKTRLGKLRLNMGIIHIGGFGEGYLRAKKDALDDAINACAAAYTDGVILGGGTAIPIAIDALIEDIKTKKLDTSSDDIAEGLVLDILHIFWSGFVGTWNIMLMNRYPDGVVDDVTEENTLKNIDIAEDFIATKYDWLHKENREELKGSNQFYTTSIIAYALQNKKPWNLITKQLDDTIIHPVTVETEVIKGVLNLVLTTTTINQLMFIAYDDAKRDLEQLREVK